MFKFLFCYFKTFIEEILNMIENQLTNRNIGLGRLRAPFKSSFTLYL